jgi:hypothetical protein
LKAAIAVTQENGGIQIPEGVRRCQDEILLSVPVYIPGTCAVSILAAAEDGWVGNTRWDWTAEGTVAGIDESDDC